MTKPFAVPLSSPAAPTPATSATSKPKIKKSKMVTLHLRPEVLRKFPHGASKPKLKLDLKRKAQGVAEGGEPSLKRQASSDLMSGALSAATGNGVVIKKEKKVPKKKSLIVKLKFKDGEKLKAFGR